MPRIGVVAPAPSGPWRSAHGRRFLPGRSGDRLDGNRRHRLLACVVMIDIRLHALLVSRSLPPLRSFAYLLPLVVIELVGEVGEKRQVDLGAPGTSRSCRSAPRSWPRRRPRPLIVHPPRSGCQLAQWRQPVLAVRTLVGLQVQQGSRPTAVVGVGRVEQRLDHERRRLTVLAPLLAWRLGSVQTPLAVGRPHRPPSATRKLGFRRPPS